MFNNILLVRTNSNSGNELERFRVPITYAPKEKYVLRLGSDPDLNRATQVTLPRMSFELTGFAYDPGRKQNSLLRNPKANTSSQVDSQYMGVPYDLSFDLQIYAKHIDDGTHIVEQILPYFNPDYTVTVDTVPEMGFLKDVPIILNSVSNIVEHEGNFDSVRYVSWTLSFTMKAYFYGPVTPSKIIRKAITNIKADPQLYRGQTIKMNVSAVGNSAIKIDDIVYQGNNYTTATAYGTILAYTANTGQLLVGGAQGNFEIGSTLRTTESNTVLTLTSFDTTPITYATITIEPDPITANANSDYGYTTTIVEFPDTEV
jgi:hypothetical protein